MNFFFRSKVSAAGYEQTVGLWKMCSSVLGQQICMNYDCAGSGGGSLCGKILTGRAFMTLACILSAIAVICFILSMITTDNRRSMILIAGKGLAVVCLVFGIIGVAVGISGTTDNSLGQGVNLGAGSIIGIIALIINLFAAIGSLIIH